MVTEEIKKAVEEHNIDDVRSFLASTINFDRTLAKQYKELWDYCLTHGISEEEIYQTHNGKDLSSEITKENFSKLRGGLLSNFSKERIEMLKIVGKAIYENSQNADSSEENINNDDNKTDRENSHPSKGAEIVIGIGATILAGAILGLGFKVTAWKAIGGAIAIGAAATIGTKIYKNSKK